jgi:hypothetical protein
MWIVLTERLVKTNTGATEKFAPRTQNNRHWTVSGPFKSERAGERAVMAALSSHTTITAMCLDVPAVDRMLNSRNGRQSNHQRDESLREAVRVFGIQLPQSV